MKKLVMVVVGVLVIAGGVVVFNKYGSNTNQTAGAGGVKGFNEFGYNYNARIFNGPADGVDKSNDGAVWGDPTYANDKLVMKWTEGWDRGNYEGWANPPYTDAWEDNEWNGATKDGSGEVWHYKIKWVGSCGADGTPIPNDGGYCIWGQFAVLMDQGTYTGPDGTPIHEWLTHAIPNGYGVISN
jgi:hypothetical protein